MLDHLDMLDEARLTAVDDAIVNGPISMVVQNITSTSLPQDVLYGECCACLFDTDGTFHRASEFIPNLEALGATPFLDRHVLNLASDQLDTNTAVNLGCNVSVDNMSDTDSWASIYNQIASRSHLASRLKSAFCRTCSNNSNNVKRAFQRPCGKVRPISPMW